MPLTADRAASHELWADVHGRLRAFVGRRVGDPHTADDLAQDVLLRLHHNIGHCATTNASTRSPTRLRATQSRPLPRPGPQA